MRLLFLLLCLPGFAAAHPPCSRPELWLAEYDRAAVPAAFCAVCDGKCDRVDGQPSMPWSLAPGRSLDRHTCGELAYLRHAIRSWHGHLPQTRGWRRVIESQPGYTPRAERPLPAAAVRNLKWIKAARARCLARNAIKPRHREIIARFFAEKAKGRPRLPKRLFVDGQPVSPKRFLQFLNGEGLYGFGLRTWMEPIKGSLVDLHLDQRELTTINVANGLAGVDCMGDDESCEGYEWSEFVFDKQDRLIAIHLSAAACPFVDVRSGDGSWRRVGETLRHINHRARKDTQQLGVPAPVCADGIFEVRLSEEKDETTYLDAIAVELDGRRLLPMRCAKGSDAVCAIDGRVQTLQTGETDVYRFAVPDDSACRRVILVANGHYEPAR
jgi:hypothetical protein